MSAMRLSPFVVVIVSILVFNTSAQAALIRFLPWDDEIAARKIGFNDGKKVTDLQDLHPQKRSKAINLEIGEVPAQLVAMDRTSPDGKPVSVPIKLAPGMQSPLILILPDPGNPSGLRSFVIEDNSASFSWGMLRFINATGKALLVREEKVIKPLAETWTPVDIDPGGQSRNVGIQIAARADLKTILYSAVWEHDPNVRKLVIVLPGRDASTGVVDLKVIPEDRRSTAPTVPATPAP